MCKASVCPVCSGRGFVANGFYSTTTGQWFSSTSASTEKCRSCNGSGIVWPFFTPQMQVQVQDPPNPRPETGVNIEQESDKN